MDTLRKTLFFVFMSFVLSITIFLSIMLTFPDYTYLEHEKFYSQELSEEKIFIFGSSQTYAINPTIVNDFLKDAGYEHVVYHLGQGSFDPEERLRTSDLIISQSPDIVIYGISYMTFYSHGRNIVEQPTESFISPPKISDLLSLIPLPVNNGLLSNPKFATINTISHFLVIQSGNLEEEPIRPYQNTPFFRLALHSEEFANPEDLEINGKYANYKGNEIYPIDKNRTYFALKELIHDLHDNNIQVIIFTTPHLKTWMSNLPEEQKEIFNSMLDDLEKEFNFKVFKLHDKYDSVDIWNDHDHLVSNNNKTNFYSEEIAKILLSEIDT